MTRGFNSVKIGLTLILLGFAIAFIAILIPMLFLLIEGGEIGVGGCVLILFIPICFGYGNLAIPLIVVAAILMLVVTIVGVFVYTSMRKTLKSSAYPYV